MPVKLEDTLCPRREVSTSTLPEIFGKPKSFIIAEAGINHNGKIELAKELIRVAKDIGANAVKFQTFWNLGRLKEYEFGKFQWQYLKSYCDEIGILFLSTPHTLEAIDFLENLVPIYKVASPFLTDREFIEKVASMGKPILLSTGSLKRKDGMASLNQIKQALEWMPIVQRENVILLHCISKYPCNDLHLDRIERLKRFKKIIGLSDHTKNIQVPPFPIIEKHLMLNENCIDANVSLNPEQFKQMVDYVKSFYCQF